MLDNIMKIILHKFQLIDPIFHQSSWFFTINAF
nr:MAG TPA: hypothetical protein [Caudoviricetes sp.]